MLMKCEKQNVYSGVFRIIFFAFCAFFFMFRTILCQGRHSHKMSKGVRPAVHLSWNMRKWVRNARNEKCTAEYFASLFLCFMSLFLLFAFHTRVGIHAKVKGFCGLFFSTALIEHEIRMKCKKCILRVSYFVVCFPKTLTKCESVSRPYGFLAALTKKNLNEIQNVFNQYFVFYGMFHENICKNAAKWEIG